MNCLFTTYTSAVPSRVTQLKGKVLHSKPTLALSSPLSVCLTPIHPPVGCSRWMRFAKKQTECSFVHDFVPLAEARIGTSCLGWRCVQNQCKGPEANATRQTEREFLAQFSLRCLCVRIVLRASAPKPLDFLLENSSKKPKAKSE